MGTFFEEAKRRRVFRVAALYAIIGLAVIEAGDIILPTLSVPEAWFTVLLVGVLLGFPLALVVGWFYDLTSHGFERTPALAPDAVIGPPPGVGAAGIGLPIEREIGELTTEQSVAVLPFTNMSEDAENEYFSDGVTEELINALTKVPGLRVAARTSSFSFKGKNEDVTEIGRSLRVATVLEGSVRRYGQQVRITAQLVKTADGYHIWSEVYERELADIFAVQEEIARKIVDKLKVELMAGSDSRLVQQHTENLEAYNLYLKGRFFWNQREAGLLKAIEYLEQAVEADPQYALAFSGLADCHILVAFYGFSEPNEAFPIAQQRAATALELDPTLGEAYISSAFARMLFDWDWATAEGEFLRGLELSPGYATGHHWYSELLMAMGRPDEAITEAKRAIELDPIGLIINTLLGMAYYFSRDNDRAVEACLATLELLPDFLPVYLWLGLAYVQQGEHEEAIGLFERARVQADDRPAVTALLAYAYAAAGKSREAEALLKRLEAAAQTQPVSSVDLARIYAGLGDSDASLDKLEVAFEERAIGLVWLSVDPTFDPVRSDPRFQDILLRMDLPVRARA